METMKAVAEVHTKSQQSPIIGETPASVITQQPADGIITMEDINLNTDDGLNSSHDNSAVDTITDGIELKEMLNSSRDDSGISDDVATTDLGQSEVDSNQDIEIEESKEASASDSKQTCDTNTSLDQSNHVEVHQPLSTPAILVNEDSASSEADVITRAIAEGDCDASSNSDAVNQNNKGSHVDSDAVGSSKNTEDVSSVTSEGSEVTVIRTRRQSQPASLEIDVSLDGISNCSFDPEVDAPDVRGHADSAIDQVSLVDVKVEVKDEMALLSKSISEVQTEDGKVFEAKVKYQRELREARLKLYRMYKTHRQAIEKTKPYYVAKELEREMKAELDQTERDAERAKLNFEAARETEAIAMEAMTSEKAELGSIGSQGCEGREALENWNQATARVLETSKLRAEIEDRLRRKEEQFLQAERSANILFLDLKKFIEKAWPYYAMKDQYTRTLEKTRKEIRESGQRLAAAKEKYQETFSRLNLVATEIHQRKTINDKQSGKGANDNFSQFEEIHDIDSVLSALESRAENLSNCLDGLEDDEVEDIESELTIMPKSKSMFSMGRSNTRESLDEILDPKKILGQKGRRKTLGQINL